MAALGQRRTYLLRERPRRQGPNQYLARGEAGGDAEQVTRFTGGDVRFPGISGDGKTIVFEHDFGIWKLDLASREVKPIPLEIAAETQETLDRVQGVQLHRRRL